MSAQESTTTDADGERRVREAIEHAAPKNVDLLQEIMTTEDSVHALKNNEARLVHLEEELTAQTQTVREAADVAKIQMAKYRKDKDSFGRKWVYILTNMRRNLEEKNKESERAYVQAMSNQSKAEQREKQLLKDKKAIEGENAGLLKEAKKHEAAHAEIDRLYYEVFDGPTPGFPDEDEHERSYKASKQEHDAVRATFKANTVALKEIALIRTTLGRAHKEASKAKLALETAIFSGTENALVFLDRSARLIEQARAGNQKADEVLPKPLDNNYVQTHQALARHLINARTMAAAPLGDPHAANSQIFRTIQDVHQELGLAQEAQAALLQVVKGYETTAKQAVRIASRALEDSRQALQEVRQNAFETTVGHGAAAPPYHECCDRASGFESEANAECERIPDPIIDDSGLPPPPSYEAAVAEDNNTT